MDRVGLVLGAPMWFWALLFPLATLVLTLGWITVLLRKQHLSSFAIKGLGLSVQIRTNGSPTHERASDAIGEV